MSAPLASGKVPPREQHWSRHWTEDFLFPDLITKGIKNVVTKKGKCPEGCNLGNILCCVVAKAAMDALDIKASWLTKQWYKWYCDINECCGDKIQAAGFPTVLTIPRNFLAHTAAEDRIASFLARIGYNISFIWDPAYWDPAYWGEDHDLYELFWKGVRPSLQTWYAARQIKGEEPKFVVYIRCSDAPFVRMPSYRLALPAFWVEAGAAYKQAIAAGTVAGPPGLLGKSSHNANAARVEACDQFLHYAELDFGTPFAQPPAESTLWKDFCTLADAKHLYSTFSSFSCMASFCGGRPWYPVHFPEDKQSLPHMAVHDYYNPSRVRDTMLMRPEDLKQRVKHEVDARRKRLINIRNIIGVMALGGALGAGALAKVKKANRQAGDGSA